ncbi:MAG: ATP-binding cassette domain-containing protein [Clostridiales bacterium]|nr:ATP-binding cassette domain-containing protein [Clostridiales bacterium]
MIEITNLVKRYGDKKAVNGISFTVQKGEVLGFLGPNGAGKSTTMNIITGYLSSTSGTVKVNGHDILEEPEEAKKCIGYLPELPPLYLDMTVLEYLNFMCDLKKVPRAGRKEMLAKILSMVRIVDVADRLVGNLSKGYKQRVGIAQALIGDPEILILDEPTVGLDPNQILEIRKLIRNLAKDHTIILSSHILSEVQAVCDRVVIINHGKVAAIDTITDLSKKLSGSSKLLLSFKGPVKEVRNALQALPGITGINERISDSDIHEIDITISNEKGSDVRTSIFYAMSKGGWPILEFRSLDPTLEEVFLSITSA